MLNDDFRQDTIHIVMAVYDPEGDYSRKAGVALCSIFEHTSSGVHVHLLHGPELSESNKNNFIKLCNMYRHKISFYSIRVSEQLATCPFVQNYTIGALYRIYMLDVLPKSIKKVIYIDVDILCFLDIKMIWEYDLQENLLGAVFEKANGGFRNHPLIKDGIIERKKYFNSGVLLFDCDEIRSHFPDFLKNFLDFWKRYKKQCLYPDQDPLNFLFQDKVAYMPCQYNYMPIHNDTGNAYILAASQYKGKIVHFFGKKAWKLTEENPAWEIYLEYLWKTPWHDDFLTWQSISQAVIERQKEDQKRMIFAIQFLEKLCKAKCVYLWGAGEFSLHFKDKILIYNKNVYYIEENPQLQGKILYGIEVKDKKVLLEKEKKEIIVIISTSRYETEIKQILFQNGFREHENVFAGKEVAAVFDFEYLRERYMMKATNL